MVKRKRKYEFKMISYGEYSKWDRESKDIPRIQDFTTKIEAEIGTEFGYVLHIKKAKAETITFKIEHPPFKNEKGEVAPPFEGEQFISTNDYRFYLGDCVWGPLEDKLGKWELTTYHKGKVVASKIFELVKK
ncbi:DUF3859 domain-containing protein [Mariniphaga sediminis]|uniref:DUF3859 domain-containing protein n=1 Tax=Mariniphaga sediminis TaxID=1628158 RepID=A0A399CTT3_9BACT|nr:DUF3859 domain-containing protein [Mariniphaga sediminis]RIH63315.1 DUF3859 domain-containing protein [Mariniphaga sediminis]